MKMLTLCDWSITSGVAASQIQPPGLIYTVLEQVGRP